jgi:hypothetical protein
MKRLARIVIGLLTVSGACGLLVAQQLTDAQRSAIRSACRGDYQQVCANVPPGTKDSLQCLLQHSQQVSSGCRDALAPAAATSSAAPAGAAPAASSAAAASAAPSPATASAKSSSGSASAAAPDSAHPLSPRQQAMALRAKCGGDFQKFCSDVQPGGGRAATCLRAHAADLTPACRAALPGATPQ